MSLLPTKTQWNKWTLPSKYGAIGVLLAVIGILISFIPSKSINTDELARALAEKMPDHQLLKDKEQEVQTLKATIERLKEGSGDKLKQKALQALKDGQVAKATGLMEEAAIARTAKAKQLNKEAAQDWIDIGNIAYLHDSQKALKAYETAVDLDSSSPTAWNKQGRILRRLGRIEESEKAYGQALKLAGNDKSLQAVAYSNLGVIHQIRGDLDRAEASSIKALGIHKALGSKEGRRASTATSASSIKPGATWIRPVNHYERVWSCIPMSEQRIWFRKSEY